jgi:DNA mismatch repair protein MutL
MGMPHIRILADQVANQIAAGEVVERPVAVLKELVENSIDAGATKIEIEFRNGGKSYIRVEDDGHGMSQDQALLSMERHATSKIRKAADLNHIQSFGFRGEALPSISSVSRFTMRSRAQKDAEGCEILVNGGKMIHVKDCGMPVGTRIEVAHLFNSVPGRRKFLKTEVTESAHIIHMAKLYALAHPGVTFSLLEGGRTLFRSPACEKVEERVREIFGRGLAESLSPVSITEGEFSLHGLMGKPGQSRSTRKEMIFFVNRRPVESKTMSYAVLEGFHTFLPKGRFPPVILFFNLDPAAVDVNVHPAKREIRFREEAKVRHFLLNAVLAHNRSFEQMPQVVPEVKEVYDERAGKMVPQIDPRALQLFGKKEGLPRQTDLNPVAPAGPAEAEKEREPPAPHRGSHISLLPASGVGGRADVSATWRFIDRAHGDLVLFSTPEGLVALHLRAAYERIRLEQLEDNLRDHHNSSSQSLLLPEPMELDGVDRKNLEGTLPKLRRIGFELEEFGRNFYRLEGCPTWLDPGEAAHFIRDFLDLAREDRGDAKFESWARQALDNRANYTSEQRDDFSDDEIIRLTKQLLACRNPYVCPKGRPTYFEIPKRDFENRFKRKL